MVDLKEKQKEIYENKIKKGFSLDPEMNFNLLYGEVAEAYDAYHKHKPKEELAEELADVAIYLLGLAEIFDIDLEESINKKIIKNKNREYKLVNGTYIKIENANKEKKS